MGMTMTQKILAAHAGLPSTTTGQLISVNLDMVLGNDITAPVAIREFNKTGKEVFEMCIRDSYRAVRYFPHEDR